MSLSLSHVSACLHYSRKTLVKKLVHARQRLLELARLLPYAATITHRNVGSHARTIMRISKFYHDGEAAAAAARASTREGAAAAAAAASGGAAGAQQGTAAATAVAVVVAGTSATAGAAVHPGHLGDGKQQRGDETDAEAAAEEEEAECGHQQQPKRQRVGGLARGVACSSSQPAVVRGSK